MKLAQLMLLTTLSSATLALRAGADPPTVGKGQNDTHGPMKLTYRWQDDKATNLPLLLPDARIVWSDGTILLTNPRQWTTIPTVPTVPMTRVAIDVNNAHIADALKKLFAQVGEHYELDSEVPANTRITLRVRNVSFLTALQAMLEQADLSWTLQAGIKGESWPALYKIGKQSTMMLTTPWTGSGAYSDHIPWILQNNSTMFLPWSQGMAPSYINGRDLSSWNAQMPPNYWFDKPISSDTPKTLTLGAPNYIGTHNAITTPGGQSIPAVVPILNGTDLLSGAILFPAANGSEVEGTTVNKVPLLGDLPLIGKLFTTRVREERSIFTCPHCHGQVTVIRKHEAPICPECGRAFEAQWKVCPFDGAKRPVAAGEWQFCPICGKSIAGADTKRNRQ
jgi:hypothetical protein